MVIIILAFRGPDLQRLREIFEKQLGKWKKGCPPP